MPWKECTPMSQRDELICLARAQAMSVTELARRFGVHRKTVHKWLKRDREGGSLAEQSRRPASSPAQTHPEVEAMVVALRQDHPRWGGRKLARVLLNRGITEVPAPSTITDICRRHGLIRPEASQASQPWQRFERPHPNDLWQMDHKGPFQTGAGRVTPLTILDDHSRFNLALRANTDMTQQTVQRELTDVFRRYGLPRQINMDNGSPWGNGKNSATGISGLAIWMIRLGIRVSFSRPFHPQTNGKDERFHRSLKAEVLGTRFAHAADTQKAFDRWRGIYNLIRPHEALDMAVPGDRYQPSAVPFPEVLPWPEYASHDVVCRVRTRGRLYVGGRLIYVSSALANLDVALRPRDAEDGLYDVFFGHHWLLEIDLKTPDDV